ncbi:regucalcin-like, partial [Agrilus planipennis]|uniref:Regucalcin-like n=1 Tax=Agrilus planipennis TaxID=224129 RepID=A0A1W4XG75_AGRPL
QLKQHIDGVHISNGLTWNPSLKKMYYIDSGTRTVDEFDYDQTNGTISNRKPIFTLEKHNIPGIPDGMTIDSDGNLWVAVFLGSRVIKIDPRKPETLLETIKIPALLTTSVEFGGPNLDELYVTSGRFTFQGKTPEPPVDGALYRVTNTGLAWNSNLKKMYYIDSGKRTVDQFDYDQDNGTISNRQSIFTFDKHNIPGMPDGQTIDSDGNLWVAVFLGSRVIKIDPRKPETLLETIAIPAIQTTSVEFGGPNLDELYVTTGRDTRVNKNLQPPVDGALYRVTNTGSKGLPSNKVKLSV